MKKATIQLETLACPACILKIEGALKSLDGVDKDTINVGFNSSKATFNFDEAKVTAEQAAESIQRLGYEVKKIQSR